ncbi:MAG: BON domain-containing protein [Planctomycetes bacterium]|nr:BON domain-containing protein [Planctomycetota bacterium]
MTETSARSTPRRYRSTSTQPPASIFRTITASALVILGSVPGFAQQTTKGSPAKSPPAAEPAKVASPSKSPATPRRESFLDMPDLSDRVIQLAVEDELLRSAAVDGHLVNVDVEDSVVTLSGKLNNILAEQIAVGLAERIRGVESVVDEIEIMVDRRDNAELKKDVLAALQADPVSHALTIDVAAADGTVTLSGKVPSYGLKMVAGEVAMGTKGVAILQNDLLVDSQKKFTDAELQREISELYHFSAFLDDVQLDVVVKGGVTILNGNVASSFQRSYAEDLAWRAGSKDVDVRGVNVSWRHTNPLLRSQRYETATDEQIQAAVQRAFQHDPRVLSYAPQVLVDHGVVTLTGEVNHLTAKQAAERDALQTVGVRRVKNNLRTRWGEKPPTDEQIADFTRQALARDPYVEKHNIVVECENAHASLYGYVDTEFEKEHAAWTASCQKGVVHVNNYLAVRKNWIPKSDAAIQADLNDKLAFAFVDPDNQVTAKVLDGVAILQGTVDSWLMWQTAMDQAIAAGARRPHNLIEVRYGLPSGPHYYGPHDYVPR